MVQLSRLALGFACTALMAVQASAAQLTKEQVEEARRLYSDRCSGCHGTSRGGSSGKVLDPKSMESAGEKRIQRLIELGTENGMNAFDGVLSRDQIKLLTAFLQVEPPPMADLSMDEVRKSSRVLVDPAKAPAKPAHGRNWRNFVLVSLRDAGKVAVIDGDAKAVVAEIPTGHGVHGMRSSSDGRFWYAMGRDGKLTKIDLWMDPPQAVAEVRLAHEARDVAVSRHGEFKDKYVAAGGYSPARLVILDAATLAPLAAVPTGAADARVAGIQAVPGEPAWLVAIKEKGQLWKVDYSDAKAPKVTQVELAPVLHGGFFAGDKRHFQIGSTDELFVVDTAAGKVAARMAPGRKPHPSPGANWVDAECGPVSGTVHMAVPRLSVWGSDPAGHPAAAWKECFTARPDGPGLFVATQKAAKHVWMDQSLHPEPEIAQSVAVLDKQTRKIDFVTVTEAETAVATHIEFNEAGDEAWVSVWVKGADKAKGEIVVYDEKTLEEKARIGGLTTPTGKWHVGRRLAAEAE